MNLTLDYSQIIDTLLYHFEVIILDLFLIKNTDVDKKTVGVKYRQIHKVEALRRFPCCHLCYYLRLQHMNTIL